MKIGVLQATTRIEMNDVLVQAVEKAVADQHEVINLGVFPNETESYSYVDVAVMISLLIESQALDFVVTGCSSGQGMMLACNSLPGLYCGFVQTPQDAFLFGRINNGNVVSLPLGLTVGWCGELNLEYTLEKLFDGEFGVGYPQTDAVRKQQEAAQLTRIGQITKKRFLEIIDEIDESLIRKVVNRKIFYQYLDENGKNRALVDRLQNFIN